MTMNAQKMPSVVDGSTTEWIVVVGADPPDAAIEALASLLLLEVSEDQVKESRPART